MAKELLSVVEAAKMLGVSTRQVRNLIENGKLAAQRVGRAYIVSRADIRKVPDRHPGRPPATIGAKQKAAK